MSQPVHTEQRRDSFDSFAAHYDSVRPDYPPAVATDIASYCGLTSGSRILEIGTGTGKATRLFARKGSHLIGLEPCTAMTTIARSNLIDYPSTTIIEESFEDVQLPAGDFDLVFAAQSFHWVDTAAGFKKVHRLLRKNRMLAVFWNLKRPLPESLQDSFDELYRKHFRGQPWFCMNEDCLHRSDRQRQDRIEASGLFSVAAKRIYEWSHKYTSKDYVRLLDSYIDHRLLPEYDKRELYDGIEKAIDCHGGVIDLPYVTVTYMCMRR